MSTVAINDQPIKDIEESEEEVEPRREGPFSRGFWRREKAPDDGLRFILLEDARVPVALPRGRRLTPIQRPPRGRW